MVKDNTDTANSKPAKKQKRPPKKISESYLHNSGLYYLQRFAASSAHFRKVMGRKIERSCLHHKEQDKEECFAMLDRVIVKFQDLGLLNDEAYTRTVVNSYRRKGLSTRMIQAKMAAKGIKGEAVKKELARIDEDHESDRDAELAAALRLAKKKRIGPFAPADKEQAFDKWLAALARAGFSYDIAKNALETNKDEAEAINAGGWW